MAFTLQTQESGCICLLITGDLDLETADTLHATAEQAIADHCHTLILDLGGVEFLDSSGLGALVGVRNAALDRGVTLQLQSIPPAVQRILELSHLDDIFQPRP